MGLYDDLVPTEAEQKLLDAVARGEECDFTDGEKLGSNAGNGASWGPERSVRAEVIVALATLARADWPVANKGIRLLGARIEGALDFEEATLERSLWLFYCHIDETVTLRLARARTIALQRCSLKPKAATAIEANGLRCDGSLFLRASKIAGEVLLLGAKIADGLNCADATFEATQGSGGRAFSADRTEIEGSAFLGNIKAKGEVRLLGARIGGDLDCVGATFAMAKGGDGKAFSANRMTVVGAVFWRDIERISGIVDLTHTKAGQLNDDAKSWEGVSALFIDGFEYGALVNAPTDYRTRCAWLARMPNQYFWPQPYEHLAKVLRQMGHEHDAREIAIEKQNAYLRATERGVFALSLRRRVWLHFMRLTINYGYEPWRALYWMAFFIFFGAVVFQNDFHLGAMAPSKVRVYMSECYGGSATSGCAGWRTEKLAATDKVVRLPADYPHFNALWYSLDTFMPIIGLHQEDYWLPTATGAPLSGFSKVYLWFHISLGWIVVTMFIAGFTNIVKKD